MKTLNENMETTLIDEKELVCRFTKKAKEVSIRLKTALGEMYKDFGLNPKTYVGGDPCLIIYEDMSIEHCLNNTLAAFTEAFSNGIFYQCDSAKKNEILSIVIDYLSDRGLEDDFKRYKEETERRRSSPDSTEGIVIYYKLF